MNRDAARRVAGQLPTRFLRGYARGKIQTDAVYDAVERSLGGDAHPLVDLGCGVGLLAFYLRERGRNTPVTGIDHDEKKIAVARALAGRYEHLEFRTGDAREPLPAGVNVAAIDVLHYFTDDEQVRIIDHIAEAIPAGGVAIFRDGVRDGSMRYYFTFVQESFSRAIRWLKAERLNFPRRETIVEPFRRRGFSVDVRPFRGSFPFNNYLFVFRRPSSGTTNL